MVTFWEQIGVSLAGVEKDFGKFWRFKLEKSFPTYVANKAVFLESICFFLQEMYLTLMKVKLQAKTILSIKQS
jgi:hypothetical protein